jgi:hypothetical protein
LTTFQAHLSASRSSSKTTKTLHAQKPQFKEYTSCSKNQMSQAFGSWILESLRLELVFNAEPNPTNHIFEIAMHIN